MPRNVLSAKPLLATSLNFLLFKMEPRSETTLGLETQHSELQQVKLPSGRPNCNTRPHYEVKAALTPTAGFGVFFFGVVFLFSALMVVSWMMWFRSEADAHTVCGFDPVRWSHLLSGADPDRPGRALVGPAGGGRIDSIEPITYWHTFPLPPPPPLSSLLMQWLAIKIWMR